MADTTDFASVDLSPLNYDGAVLTGIGKTLFHGRTLRLELDCKVLDETTLNCTTTDNGLKSERFALARH